MKLHPALFLATISCRSAAVAPSPAPPPPSRSDVPAAPRDVAVAPTVAAPDTLPPPYATKVNANPARLVQRAETESPRAPAGLRVSLWARDVGEVRTVVQAPTGEVFAALRTGEVKVFEDRDRDGVADDRWTFARGLELPFGLAFRGERELYVAATSALWRFARIPGQRAPDGAPTRVIGLPGRGYNQHWTRNVAVSPDGAFVFVSVGSETNVEPEADPRAAIVRVGADGTGMTVFARGLRNPIGLAFAPDGRLFAAVNERDELGDDLPPDYLTAVVEGAHYGWPYAYWGSHEDPRRRGERPDIVARARVPDVSLGAHSAPISVVFPRRGALGVPSGDALVSLHGSWNRAQHAGYKVVRVRFRDGVAQGAPEDFLTGWLRSDGAAWGRPAGMCELADGSLLVVDDGDQSIWRVTR
jgi:glucose/arabinose dehydrogenase